MPDALDYICMGGLEFEYEKRRAKSAGEFAELLRAWLDDSPIPGFRESLSDRGHRFIRKNVRRIAVAAVAAIALLCIAVTLYVKERFHAEALSKVNHELEIAKQDALQKATEADNARLAAQNARKDEAAMKIAAIHSRDRMMAVIDSTLKHFGNLSTVLGGNLIPEERAWLVSLYERIQQAIEDERLSPSPGDRIVYVRLLGYLASVHNLLGETDAALLAWDKRNKECDALASSEIRLERLLFVAECALGHAEIIEVARHQRRMEKAEESAKAISAYLAILGEEFADEQLSIYARWRAQGILAGLRFDEGNLDGAETLARKTIDLGKKVTTYATTGEIEAFPMLLGLILQDRNDFKQSIDVFDGCIKQLQTLLKEQPPNHSSRLFLNMTLYRLCINRGISKTHQFKTATVQSAKELSDKAAIAEMDLVDAIGQVNALINQFPSRTVFKKEACDAYNWYGNLYSIAGDRVLGRKEKEILYGNAQKQYGVALKYATYLNGIDPKNAGWIQLGAHIFHNQGRIAAQLGDYKQALALEEKAKDAHQKIRKALRQLTPQMDSEGIMNDGWVGYYRAKTGDPINGRTMLEQAVSDMEALAKIHKDKPIYRERVTELQKRLTEIGIPTKKSL